jgi:hypothetical protein
VKSIQEELNDFVDKVQAFASNNLPSWLTPNSTFVGIRPGHNLDLLEVSFDFRIERWALAKREIPQELKDPSKPDLSVLK